MTDSTQGRQGPDDAAAGKGGHGWVEGDVARRPPAVEAGGAGGGARDVAAAVSDFRLALQRLERDLAGVELLASLSHHGEQQQPGKPGEPGKPGGSGKPGEPTRESCRALLKVLRRHCPDLLPAEPLPPGKTASPVPVPAEQAAELMRAAVGQAAFAAAIGRAPTTDTPLPGTVLWQEGVDSLLVSVGDIGVELGEGEVFVHIPVRCDQIPAKNGTVQVRFVVGTPDRPAGVLAATSTRPVGPEVVVERWGDALVAVAWRAFLDMVAGIAGAAGRDLDGVPLVPAAVVAAPAGLAVLPQSRHPMDRVGPGTALRCPST